LNFSFKKAERLSSRKAFETLLKTGSTHYLFPLKVVWLKNEVHTQSPVQIAFAVPKRRFKRANKRNLIKRRLREAYRLNKASLYQFLNEKEVHIHLLIIYIAPEVLSYHEIEPKIKLALNAIMGALQKTN
jgi:ribonuclease P protein component